jgi:cytochrome P450
VPREVLDEAETAGPADRAGTIAALRYLTACLLETGRLFPPVTKTFHAGSQGSVAHYFPLLQRDDRLGHTVHGFRPNRWLSEPLDAPAAASNLFLRGPRACPGMDLILFVCRAALVRMIAEQRTSARVERLTSDPLPVSFPSDDPRFTVAET